MNLPSTHGPRRTISWAETRPETRALVAALRDTLSNEEAWAIAQDHLDQARADALRSAFAKPDHADGTLG